MAISGRSTYTSMKLARPMSSTTEVHKPWVASQGLRTTARINASTHSATPTRMASKPWKGADQPMAR